MIDLRLGIYGGTFNPPHIGHVSAAAAASEQLKLDKLFVIPAGIPPHKKLPIGSPIGQQRMDMTQLSFSGLQNVVLTDMELTKEGASFTIDTVDALKKKFPDDTLYLIMGTDMYLTLELWKDAEHIIKNVTTAVFSRKAGDMEKVGLYADKIKEKLSAQTVIIHHNAIDISSSELRRMLPERRGADLIEDSTYSYIINKKLYGAKPDFGWLRTRAYDMLRPNRIAHVTGCEEEAVKLARFWGADENEAREAAILHDITKRLDLIAQLQLCVKYDIMTDAIEQDEVKLLHAKTGAATAREEFGASDEVHDAIAWHTTGRANMALLEKIIYIADYIEPTREFDGIDELRTLAYSDIDMAIIKGLEMSIADMSSRGIVPHERTKETISWFVEHTPQYKGDL